MANEFLTPNMSLVVPIVSVAPGPDWASDLNASLTILDQHSHQPGSGVQINPTAIDINANLPFNNNNATLLRTSRFFNQTAILSLPTDLGCLYEAVNELYYNDGVGNVVKITNMGSVVGSAGTITGLPSGTASAAYVAGSGTFVFQQATSTAANIDAGSLVLRYPGSYPSPAGNGIVIRVPSSISSLYSFTLPALPTLGSNAFIVTSTVGVMSTVVVDGVGLIISGGILQLNPGGITTADIGNGQVTGAKIASATITNANIASMTILGSNILNGTIGGGQIANGTILGTNIASATITGSNVASNTIAETNLVIKPSTSPAAIGDVAYNNVSSGTFSTSSTSPVGITNANVSLATHGSPVAIKFFPNGTFSNPSFLNQNTAAVAYLILTRNSTVIQTTLIPNQVAWSLEFIDVVAAGTYNYIMSAVSPGTGTLQVYYYSLLAWEL